MYTSTQNNYVSLSKKFQQHLYKEHRKNGVIYEQKWKKGPVKENVQTESIMFRIMLMLHTNIWKLIATQSNSHNYCFSKNYHFCFDPNIGNVVCAIFHILCACVACTSLKEKSWISCIPSKNKNAINLSPSSPIGQS